MANVRNRPLGEIYPFFTDAFFIADYLVYSPFRNSMYYNIVHTEYYSYSDNLQNQHTRPLVEGILCMRYKTFDNLL